MELTTATVTLKSAAEMSQSRKHSEPKLEGEAHDAYDQRTWRSKLTVDPVSGEVCIPSHGLHQALMAACKYSSKKISGQGKKTWTAKFSTGLLITDAIKLGFGPDDAEHIYPIELQVSSTGTRGIGKRVPRVFPMIRDWTSTFDVTILDPIITEDVFAEMLGIAGMYIGVGRFRPEVGGYNGRFIVDNIEWSDQRQFAEVA